jgi:hypothetical protein
MNRLVQHYLSACARNRTRPTQATIDACLAASRIGVGIGIPGPTPKATRMLSQGRDEHDDPDRDPNPAEIAEARKVGLELTNPKTLEIWKRERAKLSALDATSDTFVREREREVTKRNEKKERAAERADRDARAAHREVACAQTVMIDGRAVMLSADDVRLAREFGNSVEAVARARLRGR